ncbi:hypothetical protein LTR53_009259 [Teratosphaeriaceae sp. CCFEE 6253]|nr:hypothetical protein LTR53_009259 [Teratosphaeriaceae sp. CCFEE 6253]
MHESFTKFKFGEGWLTGHTSVYNANRSVRVLKRIWLVHTDYTRAGKTDIQDIDLILRAPVEALTLIKTPIHLRKLHAKESLARFASTSRASCRNLRSAIDSIGGLYGKRIRELACGAGHYSSKYLAWGAESVTGLDISSGMLDAARAQAKAGEVSASKLRFLLGDATDDSLVIEGGPFDVVMTCWLLN